MRLAIPTEGLTLTDRSPESQPLPAGPQRCSPRTGRPLWIKARLPAGEAVRETFATLERFGVATVCQEARCPNLGECFAERTAAFMILGRICTRACTFCAVAKGASAPPDPDEPVRLAGAALAMGLRYVVVTSVTRDDLPDGGAAHFRRCAEAVKAALPAASIEVLVPDFGGQAESLDEVLRAPIDVLNHNIETVPRLYAAVRPAADFERSLALLARAARAGFATKSGLMLGLGETDAEIEATLGRLRATGCSIVTLGQYLQPTRSQRPVARYVPPEEFARWAEVARSLGFNHAVSGPLVRSSYRAATCWRS